MFGQVRNPKHPILSETPAVCTRPGRVRQVFRNGPSKKLKAEEKIPVLKELRRRGGEQLADFGLQILGGGDPPCSKRADPGVIYPGSPVDYFQNGLTR